MDSPPPGARSSGALFDRTTLPSAGVVPTASDFSTETISVGEDRIFGFESELEANLTFMPMTVRFKLDKCGIKLSLAEWQRMPEHRRRELLRVPCDNVAAVANYRRVLCSFVRESSGTEPPTISDADHPLWMDGDIPEQLTKAAEAIGLAAPAPARWRALTALERFALVKLSRDGRDHRNLEPALREFGLCERRPGDQQSTNREIP
jgi:hypothetical protein